MDPSLLILTLGVCFCFLAPAVRSQQNVSPGSQSVPPPSKQSPPPVPPPPPPPPLSPRPPPPPQQKHHPPPPTKSKHSAPEMTTSESKHSNHDTNHHKSHGKSHPPIKQKKPNWGKKLGLMFLGVAAILQVCVVAFLLVKRRQLLKADSRF
ncbi:hypothetical protein HAX54_027964 [Datura stramonium]|uniref:Uncharacterized protein n=1 Tax=Datura stramonium TaxID=4076 RepID=A0ABS8V667_DATST|nr:hypothetical protein [Datura stramonium]